MPAHCRRVLSGRHCPRDANAPRKESAIVVDIRTALLLGAVTTLLLGILLAAVQRGFPPMLRPALRLWLRGNLLQPLGFVLYAMRGHAPAWLTIVVANVVIMAAFCDYLSALCRLLERREPRGVRIALLSAVLGAAVVFTYPVDSIIARIVVISAALAVVSGFSAFVLLAGPWRALSAAKRVTGIVFVFGAVVLLLRMINTLLYPEAIINGLESTVAQVVLFSTGSLMPLLGSYGFLLLCTDRMRIELERTATTDHLTGLLNRRAIESAGRHAVTVARERGSSCAVVMIDIDHFKRVNDERGHAGGDDALVQTVARIVAAADAPHTLGRFGGEEFLLLLPQGDAAMALTIAERIRAALADVPLALDDGPWPATLSLGAAALLPRDRDFDDMVRRADGALYVSKETGRNRVTLAGGRLPPS